LIGFIVLKRIKDKDTRRKVKGQRLKAGKLGGWEDQKLIGDYFYPTTAANQ